MWVQAGAHGVVIVGRRADRLEKIAAELRTLNGQTKILAVPADMTAEKSVQNLFAQIQQAFGRVPDVVLASAGAMAPVMSLHQQPLKAWWNDYVRLTDPLGLPDPLISNNAIRKQTSKASLSRFSAFSELKPTLAIHEAAFSLSRRHWQV